MIWNETSPDLLPTHLIFFYFHGKDCSRRSWWRGCIALCCSGGEHNKMRIILRTEMWVVQVKRWASIIFDSVIPTTYEISYWDDLLGTCCRAEHIKTVCCCFLAEWLQASNQNLTWQLGDLSSPVLFHISSLCFRTSSFRPICWNTRLF